MGTTPPPLQQPAAVIGPPPPVVAPVMVPFPEQGRKMAAEPIKLEDPEAPGPFARVPGLPPPWVVFPGLWGGDPGVEGW